MSRRMPLLLPVTRRTLLASASSLALMPLVPGWMVPAVAGAAAEEDITFEGDEPPLPDDLRSAAGEPAFSDYEGIVRDAEARGSAPPTDKESAMAFEVLGCAPYACEPYKIAEYFNDVGQGKYEAEWRPFASEWPVRANPVIVEFFRATQLKPEGDKTAWCAAFVNWCIARGNSKNGVIGDAERKLGTRSAASGSFRCWQKAEPKIGDIAVFAEPGTEGASCSGKGHVGFYMGIGEGGRMRVLGGNQKLSGTNGAVTMSLRRKARDRDENRWVGFYGFRTSAALQAPPPTPPPAAPAPVAEPAPGTASPASGTTPPATTPPAAPAAGPASPAPAPQTP